MFSTLCWVCRRSESESEGLRYCARCRAPRYCSAECQTKDWKVHKQSCKHFQKLREAVLAGELGSADPDHPKTYVEFVGRQLKHLVESKHGNIQEQDRQLVGAQRRCSYCYALAAPEGSEPQMQECGDCEAVSFCSAHRERVLQDHGAACSTLDLARRCQREMYVCNSTHGGLPDPPPLLSFADPAATASAPPAPLEVPRSWDEYFAARDCDPGDWSKERRCIVTFKASFTATLWHFLGQLQEIKGPLEGKLRVHLVGANISELQMTPNLEEAFHYFPNVTALEVVLVGPELPFGLSPPNGEDELCPSCRQSGRQLSLTPAEMLYHDFVKSKRYEKPDVAVLLNSGIHEDPNQERNTWVPTLKHLRDAGIPTFLTSFTEMEALADASLLTSLGCNVERPPRENALRGLLPMPDMECRYQCFHMNAYVLGFHGVT